MLVLTRKPQEKIQIGDDITVTVIKTKGKGVRIGIEAPSDMPVLRGELTAEGKAPGRPATHKPTAPRTPGDDSQQVCFARVNREALPKQLLGGAPLAGLVGRRSESCV